MRALLGLFILSFWAAGAGADVATSANYAMTALSIDSGGQRSSSANYANDGSIAAVGGMVSSGSYSGIVGYFGQINNPPIARPDLATRLTNGIANINLSYIIANDSDPDGDELRLFDADRQTPLGGNIGFFPESLQYTPPPGYNGVDSFSYTIADAFNDTATAVITVVVAHLPAGQNPNTVLMYVLADGQALVRLDADGGFNSYTIQWTDDLNNAVWRDLASTGAGSGGDLVAIDSAPGATQRFYRAVFR